MVKQSELNGSGGKKKILPYYAFMSSAEYKEHVNVLVYQK